MPARFDKSTLYAIRAVYEGKASEDQQKRAMDWLIKDACHIGRLSFQESPVHTAFSEGERAVGLLLVHMMTKDALDEAEAFEAALQQRKARQPRRVKATERGEAK